MFGKVVVFGIHKHSNILLKTYVEYLSQQLNYTQSRNSNAHVPHLTKLTVVNGQMK